VSEHLATVQMERAKFPPTQYGTNGQVLNPLGAERAWTVTNNTAYLWRGEDWGLISKPDGDNWQGYSVDKIANIRLRQAVDVLGDSTGAGTPQWAYIEWEDRFINLWRDPLPPESPQPPIPPDPPGDLEARITALEDDLASLRSALKGWVG